MLEARARELKDTRLIGRKKWYKIQLLGGED
jgi:hypothetical protein